MLKAMQERHSVRFYTDQKIVGKVKEDLIQFIDKCNKESGLHMQLVLNEPKGFESKLAHYGMFKNVKNYIAVVGKKDADLEYKCGYYGEQVVLYAQKLGLRTCWVALTYTKVKEAYEIREDEKLCLVIAIGYGANDGVPHKSKPKDKVMKVNGEIPTWFEKGVEAALLAPTAVNQQKFIFSLDGNKVELKPGLGFYSKVDLGIVAYHFELGAGKENFKWK